MAKKKITNLDSLMFFTGLNANINAQALEDRKYDIFSDEYIGKLQMNKDYDSVFSYTPTEIFVETTPKYSSIKDITQIAYSYVLNKSSQKPTVDMYINKDRIINLDYDYEKNLNSIIDNSKSVSLNDIILILSSLNNSMYNKQKYYSKSVEIHDILNKGIEYKWMPTGSSLYLYDEENKKDYELYIGDNYLSYTTHNISIQEEKWNEELGTYEGVTYTETKYDAESNTYTYTEKPKMIDKTILDFKESFYEIVSKELDNRCEEFKTNKNEELLSYYIYDLNTNLPILTYSLSFGKTQISLNINYDGEFNNWFHNRMSFNLVEDGTIKITPAEDYYFNFAINENELLAEKEILKLDKSYNFNIEKNDNISLLSPYKCKRIDFSEVADKLTGELDLLCDYNKKINYKDRIKTNWLEEKGSMLEELIIGKEGIECQLTSINGLEEFKDLKVLDLTGCNNLISNPDLSGLEEIKDFNLQNTNISVFAPARYSNIDSVKLGENIESIILNDITFKNNKSFQYVPNEYLTTLEINNVVNLDSYKFIVKWIEVLDSLGKLDGNNAGSVNYVNLTGLNWNNAKYDLLLKLSKIELNNFTGNIVVTDVDYDLYRRQYRKLIDIFGKENVNNANSPLNLVVHLLPNAFNVNVNIQEEFTNSREIVNEYGQLVIERFQDFRNWDNLILNIDDTITGNSFIDYIVNNSDELSNVNLSEFINNNGQNIGLCKVLNDSLILPENTENPERLSIGDILLYGKNIIIFVTKDIVNINQNFTKLGKIKDIDIFNRYINNQFTASTPFTFTSMEEEITGPNEDNIIEVDYDVPTVNENNMIYVEYEKY